ncbi:MAG: hypothetical protein ACQEXJ_08655 [Myxococcota bacterium]
MTPHASTLRLPERRTGAVLFGALAASTLVALGACGTPTVDGGASDPDAVPEVAAPDVTDTSPDAGPDVEADVDGDPRVFCDPENQSEDCPEGMVCHSRSRFCVDCLFTEERCSDEGAHESCPAPESIGIGDLEGGFWQSDPCPAQEACNPSTSTCEEVVCTPGLRRCRDPLTVELCNEVGTQRFEEACDTGKACYDDTCKRLRNNVLLLFDTSGSMTLPIDTTGLDKECKQSAVSCLEPPVCDDPDDPLMMFTLAKRIFAETLQGAIGGDSQFALQRFPQGERNNLGEYATIPPNCGSGWYAGAAKMTGDDDGHTTEGAGWFGENMDQVLVVPFPARSELDNTGQLLKWLDFEEKLGPGDIPCDTDVDCPDGGRCDETADEGRRCWYHKDPELRAAGVTPLGRSLYYAGEYLRRFVLVDGKPCNSSADCRSAGYVCDDGACRDPYHHCRDTWIIVFTDGEESEATDADPFFMPDVQAKRLAYGLGCDDHEDCRGGASCVDGVCLGPDQSLGGVPTWTDPQGYDALSRPDGSPISVRTAVLNFRRDASSGSLDNNDRIAIAGGGTSVDVYATDPEAMAQKLDELMARDLKCSPEDL